MTTPTLEQLEAMLRDTAKTGNQYPNCTYVLRAQGKTYPRTCHECGLAGPCKLELDAKARYSVLEPAQAEMAAAIRDACTGGVGYLLDGVRISPERVQLVRPPVEPVPANHESGFVRVSRESLRIEARRLRYRAKETYGFAANGTDAGAQMLHTASTLDVFADFASDNLASDAAPESSRRHAANRAPGSCNDNNPEQPRMPELPTQIADVYFTDGDFEIQWTSGLTCGNGPIYTADQLREYGRACVAAERAMDEVISAIADNAGWVRDDGRTYLSIRVDDGADLSCKAFRRDALTAFLAANGGTPAATGSVADIPDAELLGRAVRNVVKLTKRQPPWARVMDVFALGSTYSAQLCRRFGIDPGTGKRDDERPPP